MSFSKLVDLTPTSAYTSKKFSTLNVTPFAEIEFKISPMPACAPTLKELTTLS